MNSTSRRGRGCNHSLTLVAPLRHREPSPDSNGGVSRNAAPR